MWLLKKFPKPYNEFFLIKKKKNYFSYLSLKVSKQLIKIFSLFVFVRIETRLTMGAGLWALEKVLLKSCAQ